MGLVLARVESPLWARAGTAQLPALKRQIIFSLEMNIDDGMVTYHIWTCNVRSEHGAAGWWPPESAWIPKKKGRRRSGSQKQSFAQDRPGCCQSFIGKPARAALGTEP